jgi:hypothetical protein
VSETCCSYDIEIDAPDGAAAVELENRLWYLTPTTVGHGSDWIVEVPGPASLDEINAIVRAWLADVGCPCTSVRADGHVLDVESRRAPARRRRAFDFIG